MFSKTLGKAALFGASTVASLAFTGAMMANSAQAASISYYSEFSVDLNSLDNEVITGDFSFTKTELGPDKFSYNLTDFNLNALLNLSPSLNFDLSFTLDDVKENSDLFNEFNNTVVEPGYRTILGSVLGTTGDYIGDGDFPPENLTFGFNFGDDNFEENEFDLVWSGETLDSAAELLSGFLEIGMPTQTFQQVARGVFGKGGTVNFTTTTVPEPGTIFALGAVGVGLTATRRRRTKKKIKQKTAV